MLTTIVLVYAFTNKYQTFQFTNEEEMENAKKTSNFSYDNFYDGIHPVSCFAEK